MKFTIISNGIGNFVTRLFINLVEIFRPLGECREGSFSDVNTDIPFSGEVLEDEHWLYDQYETDPAKWKKSPTYFEYRSCTGSSFLIKNSLFGLIVGLEDIGPNTLSRIIEVFTNSINEGIQKEYVDVRNETVDLLYKSLKDSRRFNFGITLPHVTWHKGGKEITRIEAINDVIDYFEKRGIQSHKEKTENDIEIYLKDSDLEEIARLEGACGPQKEFEEGFEGDYVAYRIKGKKGEAYIQIDEYYGELIDIQSTIDEMVDWINF